MRWGQKGCIDKRDGDTKMIEINETHKDKE
jgi:hypothetical protein